MPLLILLFRRWLIGALLLPVVVWLLNRFADGRGDEDGVITGRLRWLARRLARYERGPLAHDRDRRRGRRRRR